MEFRNAVEFKKQVKRQLREKVKSGNLKSSAVAEATGVPNRFYKECLQESVEKRRDHD